MASAGRPFTDRLLVRLMAAGPRVVAVGTTVVRALESAATPDGTVSPASGWTTVATCGTSSATPPCSCRKS